MAKMNKSTSSLELLSHTAAWHESSKSPVAAVASARVTPAELQQISSPSFNYPSSTSTARGSTKPAVAPPTSESGMDTSSALKGEESKAPTPSCSTKTSSFHSPAFHQHQDMLRPRPLPPVGLAYHYQFPGYGLMAPPPLFASLCPVPAVLPSAGSTMTSPPARTVPNSKQQVTPTVVASSATVAAEADAKKQTMVGHSLEQENTELRKHVEQKDATIGTLQQHVAELEHQLAELRTLPAGKISQIPVEDMLSIMREYGSEVSSVNHCVQRKTNIQKASVVRQFRRYNPNFFQHFYYKDGAWTPKLGKEGELKRRARARAQAALESNKKKKTTSSD